MWRALLSEPGQAQKSEMQEKYGLHFLHSSQDWEVRRSSLV